MQQTAAANSLLRPHTAAVPRKKQPIPGHQLHLGLAGSMPQSLALHAMHASSLLQSTGEAAAGETRVKPVPLTANEQAGKGGGWFL